MAVHVPELTDYKEELPLKGLFGLQCTDAKILENEATGRKSLMLQFVVIDGAVDANGNPTLERRVSEFLTLNGFANMKDQGKFCLRTLHDTLAIFDVQTGKGGVFDEQDFIGKQISATIGEGHDALGDPIEKIKKFRPFIGDSGVV